jgi:hypothetical protein
MKKNEKQKLIDDSIVNSLNAVGLSLSGDQNAVKNLDNVVQSSIELQKLLGAETASRVQPNKGAFEKEKIGDIPIKDFVRMMWEKQDSRKSDEKRVIEIRIKLERIIESERIIELESREIKIPSKSTILRWIK